MTHLLIGPNFSGRSDWLKARRNVKPWPQTALLGPFPDLVCTGLASTVKEEFAVAAMGRISDNEVVAELEGELCLHELFGHAIHELSGGEAVRTALASVARQGITELHIDISLEQLDDHWRSSIFDLLALPKNPISEEVFIADNHLSNEEICKFGKHISFPLDKERDIQWSKVIDPIAAASYIATDGAETIFIDDVSFSYTKRSPVIFQHVSLALKYGVLYFLIGPNGSGKTTFVRLLSGTLRPRKGIIRYGLHEFQPGKSRDRFAGLAFQNPDSQWTSQTVCGELQKAQAQSNSTSNLHQLLPTFGIPDNLFRAHPNELPFVLKKRLGIGLALIAKKPWLIFDEPTLGQDQTFQMALAEFINIALDRGIGLIVISHDANFRSLFPKSKNLLFEGKTIIPNR